MISISQSHKSLSRVIDNHFYEGLLSSAPSPKFGVLAISSSLPHAGDWLTVTPSPNLGLHFLGSEFGTCLRYWLGIPLTDPAQDCSLCHRSLDPFGDHAVACGGNSDRISRHNAIRDVLFTAAHAATLCPRREVL